MQLQKEIKKLNAAGIEVVGVSNDPTATLKAFSDERKLSYSLLSDKGSKVIDQFKVRNTDVRKGSKMDGIPHPVTVLISKDGKIQQKLTKSVRSRHTPDELIQAANSKK